jgi:8-oxo-dGTP diphosphatase
VPRQTELNRLCVVAGILVDESNAVLIADRAQSRSMQDYWEFPGGKVATGESRLAALRRELREELGIEIDGARHFTRIEHDYSDLSVSIDFFIVESWRGAPEGREGQQLAWVDRRDLAGAGLLPADAPVVDALLED